MRSVKLRIVVMVFLLSASCREDHNKKPPDSLPLGQTPEAEPVENSHRTLAGDFVVRSIEDQYAPKDPPRDVEIRFSFDQGGNFRKEKSARGKVVSTEAGSYVIGTRGELVLYVEKVGGELLGSARIERYLIDEETARSMKLRHGSGALVLEKL